MKAKFYLLVTILSLIILQSCKDDADNISKTNLVISKNLELDQIKRAYYDENRNRYESSMFSEDKKEFNYSIFVEEGEKYRVLVYGFYMENVELSLFNNSDTVQTGVQANVGYYAKYFTFTADVSDSLIIQLKTSSADVFNKNFYLCFEQIDAYSIMWNGHKWLCDGDWEVNDNNQLVFKGFNSGFSKWIRLEDTSLTNYQAEVDFNIYNGELTNFIGVAVTASNEIYDMMNLPESSWQFKVTGQNSWEKWSISLGIYNGGVGRDIGTLTKNFENGPNMIKSVVASDGIDFYVNDEFVINANQSFPDEKQFYLTSEDINNEILLINSVQFK